MDTTIIPENVQQVTGRKDIQFLLMATTIACENVLSGNGGPFGAVIVSPDGRIFGKGSSVPSTNDHTAHAEMNALRFARQELGTSNLVGCALYSSCEPCPMCLTAALEAGVKPVAFAADRNDAAAAGFDDAVFYEKLAIDEEVIVEQYVFDNYKKPFEIWEAFGDHNEN